MSWSALQWAEMQTNPFFASAWEKKRGSWGLVSHDGKWQQELSRRWLNRYSSLMKGDEDEEVDSMSESWPKFICKKRSPPPRVCMFEEFIVSDHYVVTGSGDVDACRKESTTRNFRCEVILCGSMCICRVNIVFSEKIWWFLENLRFSRQKIFL